MSKFGEVLGRPGGDLCLVEPAGNLQRRRRKGVIVPADASGDGDVVAAIRLILDPSPAEAFDSLREGSPEVVVRIGAASPHLVIACDKEPGPGKGESRETGFQGVPVK